MSYFKNLFSGKKTVSVPDDISDIGDPLYPEAVRLTISENVTSISALQRALRIGYNRAATLADAMEFDGILTPIGGGARIVTEPQDRAKASYENRRRALSHLPEQFVVFDLETTGLKQAACEIIEIGAIKVNLDSDKHETFQVLVNPNVPIPRKITSLTGITNEMVEADGVEIREAITDFKGFIGDMMLVAYNAKFDFSFLQTAAMKNGISIGNPATCALELARTAFPDRQSYRLMDLAMDMNIGTSDAHRSLADCKRTMIVFIQSNMKLGVKNEPDYLQITESEFIPFYHPVTPLDLRWKSFCFTGRFVYGDMDDFEHAIRKVGGYSANLTRKTDYLVVGSYDNNRWDNSSHSKIINRALSLRESGSGIQVISERVWLESLSATKIT